MYGEDVRHEEAYKNEQRIKSILLPAKLKIVKLHSKRLYRFFLWFARSATFSVAVLVSGMLNFTIDIE